MTRIRRKQRSIVFAVLAVIVVIDQVTKWWGWHHVPRALINVGSHPLAGPVVDHWYTARMPGAVLDLLAAGLLAGLLFVLMSRRRHPTLLLSATVMLSGWASNLLDRLGVHYLTAPGSARGVVDFIHLGRVRYNVADIFIVAGTLFLLTTVAFLAVRRNWQTAAVPTTRRLWRAPGPVGRLAALAAGLGLLAVVAVGATNDDGVTAPRAPAPPRVSAQT